MTLVGGQLGSPEVKVKILAIVSVVSSQSSQGPGLYLHFIFPENIHSASINCCRSVNTVHVYSYSLIVINFDLSVLREREREREREERE